MSCPLCTTAVVIGFSALLLFKSPPQWKWPCPRCYSFGWRFPLPDIESFTAGNAESVWGRLTLRYWGAAFDQGGCLLCKVMQMIYHGREDYVLQDCVRLCAIEAYVWVYKLHITEEGFTDEKCIWSYIIQNPCRDCYGQLHLSQAHSLMLFKVSGIFQISASVPGYSVCWANGSFTFHYSYLRYWKPEKGYGDKNSWWAPKPSHCTLSQQNQLNRCSPSFYAGMFVFSRRMLHVKLAGDTAVIHSCVTSIPSEPKLIKVNLSVRVTCCSLVFKKKPRMGECCWCYLHSCYSIGWKVNRRLCLIWIRLMINLQGKDLLSVLKKWFGFTFGYVLPCQHFLLVITSRVGWANFMRSGDT